MKILMISTLNLSESNGGTAHFTSIAQEFCQAGHIVDVIIPRTGSQEVDRQLATGYFNHVIFSSQTLSRLIPISKTSINSLSQTFSVIVQDASSYDWVYLRSNVLSFAVLLALKAKGFKKVLTEHNGWFTDELSMMGVSKKVLNIVKQLQVMDARLATLVRAVVPTIKENLIEHGIDKDKVVVAGNGTDIKIFHPIKREEVLKKLNLDSDYFYLGFIGDLELWQGVEVAIKAMHIVFQNYPKARLLVVGGGRHLNFLRKTYGNLEFVKFIGVVPYKESNDYINCFDIALLPKYGLANIGFSPIKLYAYAAAGRPILASDIKGIRELEPHNFLVLHTPGSTEDLASKVMGMMSNSEQLSKMGFRARQYAEAHFSWQLVSQKILQAMQNYAV